MSSVCLKLGVRGDGAKEVVTTHGLRGTMVLLLIAAGYDDYTIMLRTGHRNVMSLRSYHNLRGDIGIQQLSKMFCMSTNHRHASESTNIVPVMNKKEEGRKRNDTKEGMGNIGRLNLLCNGRNKVPRESSDDNADNQRALKIAKRLSADAAVELNGEIQTNRLSSNVVAHNSVVHVTVHNHYHQKE